MVINDLQHTECSNLTEANWTQYMCNHENIVPSEHHHNGFVAVHALRNMMYTHDVPSHIPSA